MMIIIIIIIIIITTTTIVIITIIIIEASIKFFPNTMKDVLYNHISFKSLF